MGRRERSLHLNVNISLGGRHLGGWRLSPYPTGFIEPEFWEEIGRVAERGRLDAVFLANTFGFADAEISHPWNALDPFIALTAIARATSHVGLIGTASSTFEHPYNVARTVSSLDLVSGGRAGWNVVATMQPVAAELFGLAALPSHGERYAQAEEAVAIVSALWDSWQPGALVADQAGGLFADPSKIGSVHIEGEHLSLHGRFQVPPSPQGRPIILQAGGSPQGIDLGARHADAIFSVSHDLGAAQAFYRDVKARAVAHGRAADDLLVLPGLFPVLGSTEEEARGRKAELDERIASDDSLTQIASMLGIPPESLSLDRPLPWDLLEAPGVARPRSQGFAQAIMALARTDDLTVRELVARNAGQGHRIVVGTPEQVADSIEEWFRNGAADGFNLNFSYFPDGLEEIVDHLVPELQARGIFRRDYESTTLRGNLGLAPGEGEPL